MAKAGNFDIVDPPCPLPDFKNLALDETNEFTSRLLEKGEYISSGEALDLEKKHNDMRSTLKEKMIATLAGTENDELVRDAHAAQKEYFGTKWSFLDQPHCKDLKKSLSRYQLDVAPYEVPGKNALRHPFPGFTSGMKALWPGYDEAHRNFLKKHNLGHYFPMRIAQLGMVFVSYPRATNNELVGLHEKMMTAHKYAVDPPYVSPFTQKRDLMKLFGHVEDDVPAAVVDEQGKLLGFVDRLDAERRKDHDLVRDFYDRQVRRGLEATADDLDDPRKAYAHLKKESKDYMFTVGDGVIRIMTKTTASLSALLPPFEHQGGLGWCAYVNVSTPDESLRQLRDLKSRGQLSSINVETAHAHREDVINFLRKVRAEFPNVFTIAGTVTDPLAVIELLEFCDCVKVGIAEGSYCQTSETGVGIPNAWAGLVCGLAADKKGTIIVDGWGGTREFCLGMSFKAVRGRQMGGAGALRAESSMPVEVRNGVKGKLCRGEASIGAQIDHENGGNMSPLDKEMGEGILPYWEGEELWRPMREPGNIGSFIWLCKQRLRSAMSYAGVRPEQDVKIAKQSFFQGGFALRLFQEDSVLYVVPDRKTT